MAIIIASNTLPLTTPRTTESSISLVQTLVNHLPIFNHFDRSKTTDLENAHFFTEQTRGLTYPMPGDQNMSATRMARAATISAVIKPTKIAQRTKGWSQVNHWQQLIDHPRPTTSTISL